MKERKPERNIPRASTFNQHQESKDRLWRHTSLWHLYGLGSILVVAFFAVNQFWTLYGHIPRPPVDIETTVLLQKLHNQRKHVSEPKRNTVFQFSDLVIDEDVAIAEANRQFWNNISCPSIVQTFANTCDLTDYTWGVPVILLSYGRSGSSVTWDTLSNLVGGPRPQKAREETGANPKATLRLLDEHGTEHGKCWIEGILCRLQAEAKAKGRRGIYGTKWKPYASSLRHERAQQAIAWLAATPAVRVIYNERNLLDVAISRFKHGEIKVTAHCYDAACQQQNAIGNLTIPPAVLLKSLDKYQNSTRFVRQSLKDVPLFHVTYESLYYSNKAAWHWQRLLQFVGAKDVGRRVSLADIQSKITHFATHAKSRNETLSNYAEIAHALRDTEFEKLLYV